MGTASFLGLKQPANGADHPPPSSAEVKKEYSYTSTAPLWAFGPVTGYLYLFTLNVFSMAKVSLIYSPRNFVVAVFEICLSYLMHISVVDALLFIN
jgi:hypothetical protein